MAQQLDIDRERFAAAFGKAPLSVRHRLDTHPLLTVEAIAELAEALPEGRIEQNLGKVDRVVPGGGVPKADLPPGEIARGIESNGCWMVLKNIESERAYGDLLNETLDEVAALIGDREGGMTLREGFVFLSAPESVTPSHTDPEHNLLLQIRGTKDMNVGDFPDRETRQAVLESGSHRNVAWEPQNPRTFGLAGGDGVYVPVHQPHWVQNGPEVSVSLSITFRTVETERAERVHAVNARLRRLGLSPSPPGERRSADAVKAGVSRSLGRVRRTAKSR